ncbi:MAG: AraC family transcriptional regulator [Planctomycetota bacterium]
MMNPILDCWSAEVETAQSAVVLPDGCRDLICVDIPGTRPRWFVSGLDASARFVSFPTRTVLAGARMKPGRQCDSEALLKTIRDDNADFDKALQRVNDFVHVDSLLNDALGALKTETTIESAANAIGLSIRSFQRLVSSSTGKPPRFWKRLSRVRQAGRMLAAGHRVVDCAIQCGYSDQPHLTRELRAWFGVSPKAFSQDLELCDRIQDSGY